MESCSVVLSLIRQPFVSFYTVINFIQFFGIPGKNVFLLLLCRYVHSYVFLLYFSPFYLPEHYNPEGTLI